MELLLVILGITVTGPVGFCVGYISAMISDKLKRDHEV